MTTNRELEELLEIIMSWSGFYDEAMKALPKETQQFVESTSWAGEAHKAERKKIALSKLQTIIATHDQQLHQALLLGLEEMKPDTYLLGCEKHWSDDYGAKCTCDENERTAIDFFNQAKTQATQLINKVFNKAGE